MRSLVLVRPPMVLVLKVAGRHSTRIWRSVWRRRSSLAARRSWRWASLRARSMVAWVRVRSGSSVSLPAGGSICDSATAQRRRRQAAWMISAARVCSSAPWGRRSFLKCWRLVGRDEVGGGVDAEGDGVARGAGFASFGARAGGGFGSWRRFEIRWPFGGPFRIWIAFAAWLRVVDGFGELGIFGRKALKALARIPGTGSRSNP